MIPPWPAPSTPNISAPEPERAACNTPSSAVEVRYADSGNRPGSGGDGSSRRAPLLRAFILSVMTTYVARDEDGERAIEEVARRTFAYFERLSRSSSYGRVLSEP